MLQKLISIHDKNPHQTRNGGKSPQPDKGCLQKNLQLTLYLKIYSEERSIQKTQYC